MRRKAIAMLVSLIALLLLASCATTDLVPEAMSHVTDVNVLPAPAPAPEPAPEPEPEPTPEPEPEPAWEVGQIGPHGGLVFRCGSLFLEAADPIYEAPSYDDALKLCAQLSELNSVEFRLPTLSELKEYYDQLVVSEISDVDWTYYWSCDELDDGTVMIMNFDTGFEGKFYKDMDFVSLIPVTEI